MERKRVLEIIFLTLFAGIFLMLTLNVSAAIIEVDDAGGKDHTSIQDAVDAASDGDEIRVYNGSYSEGISIAKELTLIGVDVNNDSAWTAGTAGFNGNGPNVTNGGTVFTITSDNVSIKGFNISTEGAASQGINVGNGGFDNVSIEYCSFEYDDTGGDFSVRLNPDQTYTNLTVDYCAFSGPSSGACGAIALAGGNGGCTFDDVIISNNTFDADGWYSVVIEAANDNADAGDMTINNNTFSGTNKGILITDNDAGGNKIAGDIFVYNNTFDGSEYAFVFYNANNLNAHVTNGLVIVQDGYRNTFNGKTVYGGAWLGDLSSAGELFVYSIDDAIAAASPGNTINVGNGTYTENVVIDKNVTLSGAGSSSTKIDPSSGIGINIGSSGAGCTINGFNVSCDSSSNAIVLANNPDNVTIEDNIIYTVDGADHSGISVGSAGIENLTVDSNTFIYDGDVAVNFHPDSTSAVSQDITITDNMFNWSGSATNRSVKFAEVDGVTVTGNTINSTMTFWIDTQDSSDVTISNNNFYAGIIFIGEDDDVSGEYSEFSITNNTFTGGYVQLYHDAGVNVLEAANIEGTSICVNYNDFISCSTGIDNNVGEQIIGRYNYWGHPTGPSHINNPHGTGQGGATVSDNVSPAPWYATSTTTPTTEYVEWNNSNSGMVLAYSDTIQGGIDGACSGDTVTVLAGTYDENVVIDKNVTLSGAGSSSTKIDPSSGKGISINNGDIENCNITGFNVTGSYAIELANCPSGVNISNNVIYTVGSGSQGVSIGSAGADDLTITTNTFVYDDDVAVDFNPLSTSAVSTSITITDNMFNHTSGASRSVKFAEVDGVTVTGNTINSTMTFWIDTQDSSDVTISNNNFYAGIIFIGEDDDVSGEYSEFSITNNTFTGGYVQLYHDAGVNVLEAANIEGTSICVNYNDFISCSTGIDNDVAEDIDAEYNYWGDASGPSGQGDGTGASVTTNVDYQPWLLASDGTQYDYTRALDSGWNLVSTPKLLNDSYSALSTIIPSADLELAYQYTSSGWSSISSMPDPLESVFIRAANTTGMGFMWSTEQQDVPPARQLSVNWSLIGPNMETSDFSSGLSVDVLLTNINATTSGYQTVFSPNYNSVSWTVTYLNSGSQNMLPFEGYWVFMNTQMTLAGRNT